MHVLIVGMTTSGKTSLAKKMVPIYRSQGMPSLVLDSMHDPDWGAEYQTDNPTEFLNVMRKSRRCALFVDEGGDVIGRYAGDMKIVATQSRHFGHKAHFISHGAKDIDKTVRHQCSELYLFRVGYEDAKILSVEWGQKEIMEAVNLKQGECLKITRFNPAIKLNVFSPAPGENQLSH